jgi:hypothetical protein
MKQVSQSDSRVSETVGYSEHSKHLERVEPELLFMTCLRQQSAKLSSEDSHALSRPEEPHLHADLVKTQKSQDKSK